MRVGKLTIREVSDSFLPTLGRFLNVKGALRFDLFFRIICIYYHGIDEYVNSQC